MHEHIKNPVDTLKAIGLNESVTSCMGTRDLPEMYAHSSKAVPSDFGHTFQANTSCLYYNYKIYMGILLYSTANKQCYCTLLIIICM